MTLFAKCLTKFCKGRASKKLWHSPFCSKCRSRRWRERRPVESAFQGLRTHAKQRGITFTITLEYFRAFCAATDYVAKRGVAAGCLTIDRIKNEIGYEPGNLHVLTNRENARKQFVPYFKNKQEEEHAIAETQKKILAAYPELTA